MGDLVWSSDPSQRGNFPASGSMSSERKRQDKPQQSGAPVRKHLPSDRVITRNAFAVNEFVSDFFGDRHNRQVRIAA